jgi:hypothetical protein
VAPVDDHLVPAPLVSARLPERIPAGSAHLRVPVHLLQVPVHLLLVPVHLLLVPVRRLRAWVHLLQVPVVRLPDSKVGPEDNRVRRDRLWSTSRRSAGLRVRHRRLLVRQKDPPWSISRQLARLRARRHRSPARRRGLLSSISLPSVVHLRAVRLLAPRRDRRVDSKVRPANRGS